MATFSWEKIPNTYLGFNVFCSREVQRKFYGIFNEDFLSALINFAKKEKANIYFSSINDDMFHNARMSVIDNKKIAGSAMEFPLKLNISSRENFVNSMRSIYNCTAEAVKSFKKNRQ